MATAQTIEPLPEDGVEQGFGAEHSRAALRLLLRAFSIIVGARLLTLSAESGWNFCFALLALAPLFRMMQTLSPRAALAGGALWGGALCLFLNNYGASGASVGTWAVALLIVVPGFYVYVGARLTRSLGFEPFVLAVGWVMVELVLQPLELRNGVLGIAQGHTSPLEIIGRIFGYTQVAFLIALASAWLVAAFDRVHLHVARAAPRVKSLCDWRRSLIEIDEPLHRQLDLRCRPRAPPVSASRAA